MAFGFAVSIEIFVISVGLSMVSRFIQSRFVDPDALANQQKNLKEKQKKIQELSKQGDEKSKAESDRLSAELMNDLNKMMTGNLKVMVVSLIVFLPAFGILGGLYGSGLVDLPFSIPVFHRDFSFEITNQVSWIWTYIYSSLVASLAIGAIMKAMKKKKD